MVKSYFICDSICKVQRSLFSTEGRVVEKKDETPVTIADFGVQALISLGNSC